MPALDTVKIPCKCQRNCGNYLLLYGKMISVSSSFGSKSHSIVLDAAGHKTLAQHLAGMFQELVR